MKTKYIVIDDDGKELLFSFPAQVTHKAMFQAVTQIREGGERWTKPLFDASCVSAGFVAGGQCVGQSESLGIASRPMVDTALLRSGSAT